MPEKRNNDRRLSWTTKEFAERVELPPETITRITREMVDSGELTIGYEVGKGSYREGSDWYFYLEGMDKISQRLVKKGERI